MPPIRELDENLGVHEPPSVAGGGEEGEEGVGGEVGDRDGERKSRS